MDSANENQRPRMGDSAVAQSAGEAPVEQTRATTTDEDLQKFVNAHVRLTYLGRTLQGKLLSGYAAQLHVQAPYALQWYTIEPTVNAKEERITPIQSAAAVESIELVNESEEEREEIEDVIDEAQTPG